ncbi:MAG TPA: AbgT family transporter, partial [Vicinamibacteria bacterium]|nr:AbgT family transporter [Vicinamibacteria bacterium]
MSRVSRGFTAFLDFVERVGNVLPHPASLFAIFALLVILLSGILAGLDLEVVHPSTGEPIRPVSLLSVSGLHLVLTRMVTNFTGFAPLGTVFVSMLGIGLAESSGLIGAALKKLVLSAPPRLLTFAIVFAGVVSNMASEVGYVLLVPLAAIVFASVGRHPLVGLAAAFAGVSGGYSANLLLGTVDPLLAGISEEAAKIVDPDYTVNPAANYYFMATSTFLISFAGTWVTEKIVEPRLGRYGGDVESDLSMTRLTPEEERGLRFALVAGVFFALFLLLGTVPAGGFLRHPETGGLLRSPFMSGIVAFIFLGAVVVSIAYGKGAGTIRNDAEVVEGMGKA